MDTGRRPAGICGAALLLAARMNNFRRSIDEVVQVVKIADVTLKKRLEEFKATPSGHMTIEDFRKVWLEEGADPPAYIEGIKKEQSSPGKGSPRLLKRSRENSLVDVHALESGLELAPISPNHGPLAIKAPPEEELSVRMKGKQRAASEDLLDLADPCIAQEISNELMSTDGLAISSELSRVEQLRQQKAEENRLDDLDEAELDAFLLTEDEYEEKKRIWTELNKDYLASMACMYL